MNELKEKGPMWRRAFLQGSSQAVDSSANQRIHMNNYTRKTEEVNPMQGSITGPKQSVVASIVAKPTLKQPALTSSIKNDPDDYENVIESLKDGSYYDMNLYDYDEEHRYDPQKGTITLYRLVNNGQGLVEKYPFVSTGFEHIDDDVSQYRTVFWEPYVKELALSYGPYVWKKSLKEADLLDDGLYVKTKDLADVGKSDAQIAKEAAEAATDIDEPDNKKKKKKPIPTWKKITNTPLEIKGEVQDDLGEVGITLKLFVRTVAGYKWLNFNIPVSKIDEKAGKGPYEALGSMGVVFDIDNGFRLFKHMLIHFSSREQSLKKQIVGKSQGGWHKINGEWIYLNNSFTTNDNVVYTGMNIIKWEQVGDEQLFNKRMAQVFKENPVMALLAGFNIGGLLVEHLSQIAQTPLYVISGETSCGKTLATQTLMAMRANINAANKSMDSTAFGLQLSFNSQRNTGICRDEIGSGKAQTSANIYNYAAGEERGGATKDAVTGKYKDRASDNPPCKSTIMFTGEVSLMGQLEGGGTGGNKVRVVNSHFDLTENPIWHFLVGLPKEESKTKAEEWREFITHNYGWIYPKAVYLIRDNITRYSADFNTYADIFVKLANNNKEARKSNVWSLCMLGAQVLHEILNDYGYTKTDLFTTLKHAKRLMLAELDTTPIQSTQENYTDFIESIPNKYNSDLLTDGADVTKMKSIRGWYKRTAAHNSFSYELWIQKDEFAIMCSTHKHDIDLLKKDMAKSGMLITDETNDKGKIKTRYTYRRMLHETQANVFIFKWTEQSQAKPDIEFVKAEKD